jgi:formyl-CoA transferase
MVASPVKTPMSSSRALLPPPLLGQHTTEVLSDVLQLSNDEIERLRVADIV